MVNIPVLEAAEICGEQTANREDEEEADAEGPP